MVRPSTRLALSLVIGLLAGGVLGGLVAPDPTGALAFLLVIACTTGITAYLYRSDWLRE